MATYDGDLELTADLKPGNIIAAAEKINKEITDIFNRADGIDLSKKAEDTLNILRQLNAEQQELLEKAQAFAEVEMPSHDLDVQEDVVRNSIRQMDEAMQKLTALDQKLKEIGNKQVITQTAADFEAQLSSAEERFNSLQVSMQKLIDKTKTGKPRSKLFKSMKAEAEELEKTIAGLKSEIQGLRDSNTYYESGKNSPEYADVQQQITNTENLYDSLYQTYVRATNKIKEMKETGTDTMSGINSIKADGTISALKKVNNELTIAIEKFESFGEVSGPEEAAQSMGPLMSIMTRFLQLEESIEEEGEQTSGAVSRLASSIADAAKNLIGMASGAAVNGLKRFGSAIVSIQKFISLSPFKAIQKSLSTIANLAKKAGKSLLSMASHAITNGLKNLGKAISGVSKHSSRNNNVLNKGFKTFIKYAFGVRSFFFLFRKIRTAVINGFGDLAQVHEPFNRAMSSIMTSLGYLRNSFASAFAPIIETVAPALTTFINLVASAVSQIGMLIAALTGKEFVMAIPVQKNYAASVGKTADNAGKASKATSDQNKKAKELKRTLAGFDDVEILNEDKDTDSGSSPGGSGAGGGGVGAGGLGFQTSTISGAVKDFADKLLEAWRKSDFTEIGKIVGEKLKAALESIPWTKIKKTLRKIAKVIATFLNGFLEVPGLFYTIGKTLAEGINSAFEFLNSFIQNFHWDSLGKAIREGIIGIARNLDWSVISAAFRGLGRGIADFINAGFTDPEVWTEIFTTIGHAINVVIYGLQQLIHNTDWESLVSSIGTGLSNGFGTINWAAIGDVFISAINGVIDLAYKFVTEFDFKEFGNSVGTGVSNAINNIDWAKGAATVAGVISGLFEALNGFIEEVDWKELGSKVVTTIATFFDELNWSEFGEFISNCFIALWSFFAGVIEEINWDEIPDKIVTAISEFLTGFDWAGTVQALGEILAAEFKTLVDVGSSLLTAVFEVAADIIEGGKDGILDALTNIGTWIVDNIFTPFVDGVKSAFGIASPSKEMKPLGENIIEGMLQGILHPISTISSWIDKNIFKPISGGVSSAFGIGKGKSSFGTIGNKLITDLQGGISGSTGKMNSWISSNVTNKINGFITSSWGIHGSSSESFNKFGTSLMGGLQNGLTTSARASQAWLRNVTTTMSTYFSNLLGIGKSGGTFTRFGNSMMVDLKNGINRNERLITNALSSLRSNMVNVFSRYSWSSIGNNIAVGLYNGIVRNWSWLVNTVHNLAVSMYNAAVNALDIGSPSKKFAWIGDMTTAGWSKGIATTGDRVLNAMSNITDGLIEDAENTNPELVLDGSLSELNSSLDTILSGFSDKVVTEFSMLISTLEKLGESLQLAIPGIALGQVAPYSLGNSSNSNASTISKLIDLVRELSADMVTRDDLQEIIEAINDKDFDVRLGDEQVARSANRGNKKLNRRYSPVVL